MAGFFRMEVKVVSRTTIRNNGTVGKNSALNAAAYITAEMYQKNRSAIDAAAYISGDKIESEINEKTADYRMKKGVLDSFVMLPENAPKEYEDPEKLWNAVEAFEKAKNADLFREWIICFDKHLTEEERRLVAKKFGQTLVNEGMAVQIAIHDEKDGNGNHHMHVLAPTRGFQSDGTFDKYKTYPRKYALDELGNRIPVIDKTGQQKTDENGRKIWKREPTQYVRAFNDKRLDNVSRWRNVFCDIENQYLPEEFKVNPDSYAKRGIDQLPGKHLGKAASNVHKKLEEQVNGLLPDKRQEYLQRILLQVQKEYRSVYYTNTRMIAEERKQLQEEITQSLQNVRPYTPQKEYISYNTIFNKSRIAIEYAFAKLLEFRQYINQQQSQEDSIELTLKAMEKITQAENDLITMFNYGLTASMENRLVQGVYDMDKLLLKQLGQEIREVEKKIQNLKEEENINENPESIEEQLNEYRKRIQSIREKQLATDAERAERVIADAGAGDTAVKDAAVEYAERICRLSDELAESNNRLGRASQNIAKASRRIAEQQTGDATKTVKRAGVIKF